MGGLKQQMIVPPGEQSQHGRISPENDFNHMVRGYAFTGSDIGHGLAYSGNSLSSHSSRQRL
jgi:hypothetical protein